MSTKPRTKRPEGYDSVIFEPEERVTIDQPLVKKFKSCPFQHPCWAKIRSPIAKKGFIDADGIRRKVYVPYICSFQEEGDLEECSRYHTFKKNEARDKVDDTSLQTDGAI